MSLSYIYCVITLCIAGATAFSSEDLSAIVIAVQPHLIACSKDFAVILSGNVDEMDPCFMSCLFKGIGAMNEQGNFDPDAIIEKSKELLSGEKDRKKFVVIARTCATVNEEPVSDGEIGCERAKLLMTCLMKNKGDFLEGD